MQQILPFLPNFLLIFCRITAFFVSVPFFSSRNIPNAAKIGISLYLTLIVFASMANAPSVPWDAGMVLAIPREVLVGLLLGFAANLFFVTFQVAGSFIDMQMGFGIINVIDPLTGTQNPVIGNLKYMIAVLVFLSLNGHHFLIRSILDSYQTIPLTNDLFRHMAEGGVSNFLIAAFGKMFYLAFQIAAPLVIAIFFVDVGLGILAKVSPQLNIFVIGFPIKILVGFVLLTLLVPSFLYLFEQLFGTMFNAMGDLMKIIGGSAP